MDDFVARPSPWRLGLLILLAAGFVTLGLSMVGAFGPVTPSARHSVRYLNTVGWAAILFFGLCGIVCIGQLFDRSERLRIGAGGIRGKATQGAAIAWPQIADVTIYQVRSQKMIILHLRDGFPVISQGVGRLLAGANRHLTGGDISISLTGTDRSVKDAMAAIERFRK